DPPYNTGNDFIYNDNYSKYKNAVAELPSEFITIKPAYPTIKREIYVSKTGNDANDGSINSPYLTLNKAIEKYKLLTLKEKNEWTAIYIREGRYDILTPLSLTGEVFGENGSAKLFIGAYNNEKVVLGNGKYVDGNIFKQVTNTNTDGATFGRINKNALGKIYYCDYSDLGITKLNGFSYGNAGAVPVLTFNGENQVLSRYPNSGENYISNVLQSGFDGNGNMTTNAEFIPDDKRPFNWEDTGTIGIKGQLSVTWFVNHMQASFDKVKQSITVPANQTVTKVDKTCWPISTNLKNHPEDKAHFFYYNVFEEIDMPGEWCGDDKNQRIYFYPPTQDILADDTIGITGECGDYKFKFNRVKDIVINGISFEFVEKGIEATECNNLLVQNCNFKNIQAMGVAFKFCKLSGVIYSDFRDCTRGISIVGEKSQVSNLVASRNFVQNCHFNGISANCIGIGETCGNIISHNLAENHMSSFTTIFGGSENVIEFNESRAGVLQGNEGNNIYIDGQYVSRNNHIRYNYIHDNSPDDKNIILGGAFAVDDMGEAQFIYGNIFKNLYSAAQANGGDNNIFDNNTLINCSSCSISAEPSMYGCNENLFGVSLLNDLTTSRLTNKYYSWGLNSSVKWGQRNSFAVNRISYLEDMSRLWNSGDKTSNDIMFTRGVTGTYITNNT
ncbi:MAG: right-handed parallel beta-helix repeat-containing protein, partial [Oscillospiraceae bacterium]